MLTAPELNEKSLTQNLGNSKYLQTKQYTFK